MSAITTEKCWLRLSVQRALLRAQRAAAALPCPPGPVVNPTGTNETCSTLMASTSSTSRALLGIGSRTRKWCKIRYFTAPAPGLVLGRVRLGSSGLGPDHTKDFFGVLAKTRGIFPGFHDIRGRRQIFHAAFSSSFGGTGSIISLLKIFSPHSHQNGTCILCSYKKGVLYCSGLALAAPIARRRHSTAI